MGLFQLGMLAWVLFLAVISLGIGAIYPVLRASLRSLDPRTRAVALRAVSVAPLVGGLFATALCFAPKILGMVFPGLPRIDHCTAHTDSHIHFCLNHPPHAIGGTVFWMVVTSAAIATLVVGLVRSLRFHASRQLVRQLAKTAQFDPRYDAWVVESDHPVAISVGLLEKRTVLSSGLLSGIPTHLVAAIVAHENAHARRSDGLWRGATRLLSLGHLPRVRRILDLDLELACEQACDEDAGASIGDRFRVAEALVRMERIRHDVAGFGPAALAFNAHGVSARVESLLAASPGSRWSRGTKMVALFLGCAAAAALADPLHHLTETLLHHILG